MGIESISNQIAIDTAADQVDALLEAARYDDIDDVVSLHSMGISLDAKDTQGRTVQDLNASNSEKNTPLHWACLNGHVEVVKALILSGAHATVLNIYERTPMDEAVSRGKMEVVDAINTAVAQAELQGVRVSQHNEFGDF
ncbi:Ankyrin repeat domain-containing protein 2 [Apostasia shenzhenica]|uniref:Ankyrin repeat domain-containing protein 2 n=1 Tax=Apostasia shenzhenica TaxID=1088818 RepID=A0A2I0AIN5_9ASPA|nr:Ankyrin repeat domain-containing protein 2 [Apostasia shenzhenica]